MHAIQIRGNLYRADHPRWLYLAVACLGIHQIQSFMVQPAERPFRLLTLGGFGWLALASPSFPRRVRGTLWLLLGVPPFMGALVGHLVPIALDREVPLATETAPLNLAGAALLMALGLALLRGKEYRRR